MWLYWLGWLAGCIGGVGNVRIAGFGVSILESCRRGRDDSCRLSKTLQEVSEKEHGVADGAISHVESKLANTR